MRQALRVLIAALACVPWLSQAQSDQPAAKPDESTLSLNLAPITITDHFQFSNAPTTLQLAIRSLGREIDQKHAEEALRTPLEPLWQASFWRYIPIGGKSALGEPSGVVPSEYVVKQGDPFFVPGYLRFENLQLDRELAISEKRALILFAR
ncbi:MAG: hypothetical protein QOH88_3289 [Verrucomicrobiota bacterium]